ncbi:MAG TPA: AMP-binding protein [Thermohalobaculum sp.]|nr:AMP-binding protein [Thermohalobaculum sp.]
MGALVGNRSVRDIVDAHASAQPHGTFLIAPDSGRRVTWGDLKSALTSFSNALSQMGIQHQQPVSVMMQNSWGSAQALLGAMYGGRIAAPINLAAGDPQIRYVIDHSGTGIIFVGPDEAPRLENILQGIDRPIRVIRCDPQSGPEWPAEVTGAAAPIPAHDNGIDGLLMYTSGTTGNPKGAVLRQRAPLCGGENAIIAHELTPDDRTLLVLPLFHINGFCVSLMSTLVGGMSIVVPPRFSVRGFWDQVIDNGCTWFSAVPTQYQYLLRAAEADGPPPREKLGKVRFARSASAPLSPEVHRAFEELFGLVLIETMGLTECSAQIVSNPMPPGVRKYGSPGKAYGNEIAILGADGAEVPRMESGEIAVRGDNVFRLYLRNPEATGEAFNADGWFLTGDLGHMDADGYIYVTGRRKELIIKGGENIAPREIDEALLLHDQVVEAAAYAVPCKDYGQRVEAAVKLTEGATVTEAELIALARQQVGPFKAPDRVHILDDLPRGPSGKVQRMKLAEMMGA